MTILKGIKTGLKSYSRALTFIKKHRLSWYFLFPIIFNILLFAIGYASTVSLSSKIYAELNQFINIDHWEFWGSGVLSSIIYFFLHIIFRLLFISVYAFVGGYIVLIFLSPVFAFLSEKVESILTGHDYPFNLKQFFRDIRRGILLALRNMALEIIITIILFLLSFIPMVGLFTGPALFFVTAYFYGFSFMDYSLERQKMNLHNSVVFVKRNKGVAIGNGAIFSLILIIPYIGVLISSFISIISVVAATISTLELITHNNENRSIS